MTPKGHSLYYVERYRARDSAPFFFHTAGVLPLRFGDTVRCKWGNGKENDSAAFARRVIESVKDHGVINPVNLDRMEYKGKIQDMTRHGGTRMWAARVLDLTIPALIDVKAGDPPPDGVPVDDPLSLYTEGHEVAEEYGVFLVRSCDPHSFPI